MAVQVQPDGTLVSRVHSRIGLLGNPSDGFEGACVSLSLANFYAEVQKTSRVLWSPPPPPPATAPSPGQRAAVQIIPFCCCGARYGHRHVRVCFQHACR